MAGKLTHVGAGFALDAATGRATQTARTTYLALLTAAPDQTTTLASMTEYAATGYTRQTMAMGAPAGTPRVTANTAALTFGPMTAGTGGVVTHWAEVSAASGTSGDVVSYGDFTSSRTPGVNDTLTVAVGAITVSIN